MLSPDTFRGLRMTRIDLTLQALESISLSGFIGPTLRGMLGTALRQASCEASGEPAYPGPCLYYDVFEPPRPAPGKQSPPPPYILHPPPPPAGHIGPGQQLEFGITLFGAAVPRAIALLWAVFRHGLTRGLGRERRRFLLVNARTLTRAGQVVLFRGEGGPVPEAWDPAWTWSAAERLEPALSRLPPGAERLELRLITPLDLRAEQRPVPRVDFPQVVASLVRNAAGHARFHGDAPLELDRDALKAAAGRVRLVEDATDWLRVEHDSSRQQRTIPVETRLGRLRYEGPVAPFLPLLELGVAIHLGKGRSMGFGGMDWQVG